MTTHSEQERETEERLRQQASQAAENGIPARRFQVADVLALLVECSRLREQIGEARKDSERLEWIADTQNDVEIRGMVEMPSTRIWFVTDSGGRTVTATGDYETGRRAALREAIDAARLAHPSQRAVESPSPLPQTTESSNG